MGPTDNIPPAPPVWETRLRELLGSHRSMAFEAVEDLMHDAFLEIGCILTGEEGSPHPQLPGSGSRCSASAWQRSPPASQAAGYSTVRVISADFSSGAVKRTVTGPEVGAGPP